MVGSAEIDPKQKYNEILWTGIFGPILLFGLYLYFLIKNRVNNFVNVVLVL